MAPGHGPWIADPAAKLAEYIEHREMRERRLLAARFPGDDEANQLVDVPKRKGYELPEQV